MGYSPQAIHNIYPLVERHEKSAQRSGIYAFKRDYHSSRRDNLRHWPFSYSIICAADRDGDADASGAIDIKLADGPDSAMTRVTRRLFKACQDGDPRVACVREVIGTLDGRNVDVYNRVATGNASRSRTGNIGAASDSSHLWHLHISFLRRFVDDFELMKGVAEVICGVKPGTFTGKPIVGGKTGSVINRAKLTKDPAKVTLWVVKQVDGYNSHGKKVGSLDKGAKVTGWVDRNPFGDGRYLRVGKKPHRLWYPLDSANFAHAKNGPAITGPGKTTADDPADKTPKAPKGDFQVKSGPKKGRWYDWPAVIDVSQLNKCRTNKWFSKHVFIVQHWLNRIGLRKGHSTGYWTKKDQAAYDKFRRQAGYKREDARGALGPESVNKLARRAKSPRKARA